MKKTRFTEPYLLGYNIFDNGAELKTVQDNITSGYKSVLKYCDKYYVIDTTLSSSDAIIKHKKLSNLLFSDGFDTSTLIAESYELQNIPYCFRYLSRDVIDGLIVDTTFVFGEYETGVHDMNSVYIVEKYVTEKSAKLGHLKWLNSVVGLAKILPLGYTKKVVLSRF